MRALIVLGGVCLDFFMLRTSGAQNIAKKKYMKCILSLGSVGVQHLLELELPVVIGWSR